MLPLVVKIEICWSPASIAWMDSSHSLITIMTNYNWGQTDTDTKQWVNTAYVELICCTESSTMLANLGVPIIILHSGKASRTKTHDGETSISFTNFTRFHLLITLYNIQRWRLSAEIVFLHAEWWAPRPNGRHGLVYLCKQVPIPPRDLVSPTSCQILTNSFLPFLPRLFVIRCTVQRVDNYQYVVASK